MQAALFVQIALVLMGLSVLGGLMMAVRRFKGEHRPPAAIAILHGMLNSAALALLLFAAFTVGLPPAAWIAIYVLVGTALIGLTLNLRYHDKLQPLPKSLILLHALLALVGLGFLLLSLK